MNEGLDKNKILFVGNGLDRLAGYNTDYPSFLKYYKNHYISYLKKCVDKHMKNISFFRSTNRTHQVDISDLTMDIYKLLLFEQYTPKLKSKLNNTFIYNSKIKHGKVENESELIRLIDFRLVSNLNDLNISINDLEQDGEQPNLWITFFQRLYLRNMINGNNWIDLESLIYLNSQSAGKLSVDEDISKHIERFTNFNITSDGLEPEFRIMKKYLVDYLIEEKGKSLKEHIDLGSCDVSNYGTILNFNYQTTYCLPEVDNKEDTADMYHIHGDTSDQECIVFGYDDGMMFDGNKYYVKDMPFPNFSKTSQLLNLTTFHQEGKKKGGYHLPKQDEVKKIGILGHSIGEVDYNYFQTFCDFEVVEIQVFWYYFRDPKTGQKTKYNNKQSLQEALIKMIQEMERRIEKALLHKMLIEQRIVFTELEYDVSSQLIS